jgi:hypothetical protein
MIKIIRLLTKMSFFGMTGEGWEEISEKWKRPRRRAAMWMKRIR